MKKSCEKDRQPEKENYRCKKCKRMAEKEKHLCKPEKANLKK